MCTLEACNQGDAGGLIYVMGHINVWLCVLAGDKHSSDSPAYPIAETGGQMSDMYKCQYIILIVDLLRDAV